MIRASDFLLTLAAFWLLVAALELPRRSSSSRVIQASASSIQSQANEFADNHYQSGKRQQQQIDLFMTKIKRNLANNARFKQQEERHQGSRIQGRLVRDAAESEGKHDVDKNQNSYNYYANEAQQHQPPNTILRTETNTQRNNNTHSQNDPMGHLNGAQEVQIEFLRTTTGSNPSTNDHLSSRSARPMSGSNDGSSSSNNNNNNNNLRSQTVLLSAGSNDTRNNKVYLLNYFAPQAIAQMEVESPNSERPASGIQSEIASRDIVEVGEQQQQPPFTMFPPGALGQQGVGGGPQQLQLQQLLRQQQQQHQQQNPNIRQILSNYQRYPQAQQQLEQQFLARQQQLQLQPRPELVLRPPPGATGVQQTALGNQQQQPLSPLQLLTGPLQAFLPGFGQQQLQSTGLQASGQPSGSPNGQAAPKALGAGGQQQQQNPKGNAQGQQQQQPRLAFNLLNPFGLGQPNGQQAGPNLQDLYQQLPLYQALLAARQRQEALQAAQRLRQQQQPGGLGLLGPFGAGIPASGVQQPPTAQVAGNQPAPPFIGNGLWQQQQQPPIGQQQQQQQQSQLQQPLAPPATNQFGQGGNQQQQPQYPPSSGQNQVQFDDDNNQGPAGQVEPSQAGGQNNGNNVNNQQQQSQPGNGNSGSSNNNNSNNDNSNSNENEDDAANNENNNSNNQDDQHNNNEQDGGNNGNDSGGGSSGGAQEEDPDLKQFQNLANGGDSFADLFPPGILSNNDINEIKSQQAEQARKQEDEERQKQRQQQQQHDPSGDQQLPNNNRQQAFNNQAQNAGHHNQQLSGQKQANVGPQQQQNQQSVNGNGAAGEPQGGSNENEVNGGENNEDDNGNQEPDNGQQQGDGDQTEDGPGGETDNPTAAALTSKSASETSGQKVATNGRGKISPGVEYARP